MAAPVTLATGLGGAIGSDFIQSTNQLYFVEFSGKLSRINLIPPATTISSGTGTLRGTWLFDLDTGTEGTTGDVWWEQVNTVVRKMVPRGGAQIAYLGVVSFTAVGPAQLLDLTYGSTAITGDNNASNLLVPNAVFAVRTNQGNFAKVRIVSYGYNLQIQWVTYRFSPRYQVLGTGYAQPEDIVLNAAGTHAYVTERTGTFLRVNLATPNRASAAVVSTGMTAPHQIFLDEAHNFAYTVEFAPAGRLFRIDLTSGALTVIVAGLEHAIGLLMTADLRFAYVTEQLPSGQGRLVKIELSTARREILYTSATAPLFFLEWADTGESAILTTERSPANRVLKINLTTVPVTISTLAAAVPSNPSSVAVVNPYRLLLCTDGEVDDLNLLESVFVAAGPILLGIGHVPADRIVGGYADTTADPGYFFQVKDTPFGGTLPLMVNFEKAFSIGARYYKVLVDGVEYKQPYSDYRWNNPTARFELQTITPATGYYPVRGPGELWYNHWLGGMVDTSALTNALHTITIRLFGAKSAASEIGSGADPGRSVQLMIDNRWPTARIDRILHDGTEVGVCEIVASGSDAFTFEITAWDPEGHLLSYGLSALWGDNKSAAVASGAYVPNPTKKWNGIAATAVPTPAWHATVAGDPTSRRCAHTFYLSVWDRVIDGFNYLHLSTYHKSITIMLP
ncbi:MAG: hypothetical protein ED859_01515 [Desulfuromonadales bacterium]|nr:MAG: hypothetical protein ED859_01515 [Desulfuromonadales bacterium]